MILKDDPDSVALIRLNRRPRSTTVETPEIENAARYDRLLYGFSGQIKDLDVAIHRERQVLYIGCNYGDWSARRPRFAVFVLGSCGLRQYGCACAQFKDVSKKPSTGVHTHLSFSARGNAAGHEKTRAGQRRVQVHAHTTIP